MKLSAEELVPFCNLLLVAGTHGAYEGLRNDLSLIPQVVEEALRYRAPAPIIQRVVKEDVEIGGNLFRKGEIVLLIVASANRDDYRPVRLAQPRSR